MQPPPRIIACWGQQTLTQADITKPQPICQRIVYRSDLASIRCILTAIVHKQPFVIVDHSWPDAHIQRLYAILDANPIHEPWFCVATSGSTGHPKLVVHAIDSLIQSAERALAVSPATENDPWVLALSPAAMGGLLTIVKAWVSKGVLHIPTTHWRDTLSACRGAHTAIVPQQLVSLLDTGLDSGGLTSVLVGGDAVSEAVQNRVRDWPIRYSYGSTETCGQVLATIPGGDPSDYHPLPTVAIRVDATQRLLVRTPTLALGYLTPEGRVPLDASDGFFVTNDQVQLSPFRVIARCDYRFQSGSQLVDPLYIESVLHESGITPHIVVLPQPHPKWGHVPVAIIPSDAPIDALMAYAKAHLPIFLQPQALYRIPATLSFTDPDCRQRLRDHLPLFTSLILSYTGAITIAIGSLIP